MIVSSVNDATWKLTPEGIYNAKIMDNWIGKNARTRSIELVLKIRINEGQFNRLVWIPITPTTIESWLTPVLLKLGVSEVNLERLDRRSSKAFRITGQDHMFKCVHVQHKDKEYERWYFHLDNQLTRLSDEERNELQEIFTLGES